MRSPIRRRSRRSVVYRRTGGDVQMQEGRDLWWHDVVESESDDPSTCPCEPMDSEDLLYLLYTSGTTAKPKGIAHTTAGYLVGVGDDPPLHLRRQARLGVLVRGRRRLGDRAQLHRVRALVQRHDRGDLRGRSELSGQGPLVGDRRALRGGHPVHGADRDPDAHEVGARAREEARPLVAAAAGHGRRADQPGSLGLVPRADRRRRGAGGGYVVADGDGDDPDHAAAGV